MKKFLGIVLLCATIVFAFSSCSKSEEEDAFDYPMSTLYGKWEGTAICYDGNWIDISSWYFEDLSFSIEFNADGTYYGRGLWGNGAGTYKATGRSIITYVDGQRYLTYYVKSLSNSIAEITMYDNNGSHVDLRVKKVK